MFVDQKQVLISKDDNVLPIKYFGFASHDNSLAEFFYGCEGDTAYDDEAILTNLCRYADATENEYKDFYKITDIAGVRPDGYIINFPFYLQAERDAHILLTTGPTANPKDNEYEFGNYGKIVDILKLNRFIFQSLVAGEIHAQVMTGSLGA